MFAAIDHVIRFLPDSASTSAFAVNAIFYALFWMTVVLCVLIFGTIIIFSFRYRRGSKHVNRAFTGKHHLAIELTWTVIPTLVGLVIFVWATKIYIMQTRIPKNALEVYVVGKQWMWKLQHAEGPREINELHVPVGRPVKLLMTSQDVIHSFFVPDFRTKRDVLPGRFEAAWFEVTKPGEYYIFCAEYCGTEHSRMKGRIVAMTPADYKKWLAGFSATETPMALGEKLYQQLACKSCHGFVDSDRGPALSGIFQSQIQLTSGTICEADEDYLSRSILNPASQVVAGYRPTMPSYKGQLDDAQVIALVAYLKTLRRQEAKCR